MTRRPHRSRHERGMTLLEVLIVFGVMGLMMYLGYFTLRSVSKSRLRSGTVEVAAALRATHNLATQSGMHHRLMIDLDAQTFQVDMCPDPIQLLRGDEEEKVDQEALKRLADQPNPLAGPSGLAGAGLPHAGGMAGLGAALGEVQEAESPEAAFNAAAALAGVRVGASRCVVAKASGGDYGNLLGSQGNVHEMSEHAEDIKIRRVYVQHLRESVSTGQVTINFFPLGHSEKAVLEVADDDGTQFTILVHGLTGRVEVRDGAVDPDKHMRRDAAGDEVEET